MDHFKGKSVPEHLKEARLKGASIDKEAHGLEAPGHFAAYFDCLKNSAALLLIIWVILIQFSFTSSEILTALSALSLGLIAWNFGRSSLLGYARLERLHRLIDEEQYEITHHRDQEKLELREMYEAKGFSGKLLDEVVETLMADDNRLLGIMLEEELGLTLESYEHPLRQGFGAALGTLSAAALSLAITFFFPLFGMIVSSGLLALFSACMMAKKERIHLLHASIWNLSLCFLGGFVAYFATHFLLD